MGEGKLDFSAVNNNELVNPHEAGWKWGRMKDRVWAARSTGLEQVLSCSCSYLPIAAAPEPLSRISHPWLYPTTSLPPTTITPLPSLFPRLLLRHGRLAHSLKSSRVHSGLHTWYVVKLFHSFDTSIPPLLLYAVHRHSCVPLGRALCIYGLNPF